MEELELNSIVGIKARMAASGITQERLAIAMKLERSSINRYLRGVRPMPKGFEERVHSTMDVLEKAEKAAEEARQRVLAGEE